MIPQEDLGAFYLCSHNTLFPILCYNCEGLQVTLFPVATKSIVLSLLNANAKAKIQMQLIDLGSIPERNWKGEWGDWNRQSLTKV